MLSQFVFVLKIKQAFYLFVPREISVLAELDTCQTKSLRAMNIEKGVDTIFSAASNIARRGARVWWKKFPIDFKTDWETE